MLPTFRRVVLSLFAGIIAGILVSFFLKSLAWATSTRLSFPGLLYGLPLAGFLIGGLYDRFGKHVSHGTDLILDEIHRPTNRTPGRMTPLVFFTTTISHLFGASTGREGAA